MLTKSAAVPTRMPARRTLGYRVLLRLRALPHVLAQWLSRARQRHALAALDDRLLRDVGISRADMAQEVSKPFWMA